MTFDEVLKEMTDIVYVELFGADGDALRKQLGITEPDTPEDDLLRDEMGILALDTLMAVEFECSTRLIQMGYFPELDAMRAAFKTVAQSYVVVAQKTAREQGIDLLTGKPLEVK